MIKIIFLSDTHLGFDYPIRPKKVKRRRGDDFFNNFDRVLDYANTNCADLVIHGGDLFFRTKVPDVIVDRVYERIFNFVETGIPMVIVPGNHESSRLPVSLFMQHPNIYYYQSPGVFPFRMKGVDLDVAGFPCVRNDVETEFPAIAKELQSGLRAESFKILCMHQSIEGAKVGPSDFTFRHHRDVIPIKYLPADFNLVLSGHIHRAQILQMPNCKPVIYPGSIERTAFAEKDETKGFYEIDILENQEVAYRFVELPARPMVDILLEKDSYDQSSLKKDILTQLNGLAPDSIVRFKMKNPENLYLLKVKLLDEMVPLSMNYQVAGFRERKR